MNRERRGLFAKLPGLVLCSVSVVLVAACAGPSSPDPSTSSAASEHVFDSSTVAEVDHEAGTIRLPVEHYMLTVDEIATLDSARSFAMARCAESQGLPTPWRMQEPDATGDRRYGVWVESLVERYGYDLPIDEDPSAEEAAAPLDESDLAVYDECNATDPDVARFGYETVRPGFDYETEFGWITDFVLASDEGREVIEQWGQCARQQGLEPDEDVGGPFYLAGTNTERTEANIRAAVADVACKTEVDLVQRLADLEAGYQAPAVRAHASELEAMRADYDRMLAEAREYLAAHS